MNIHALKEILGDALRENCEMEKQLVILCDLISQGKIDEAQKIVNKIYQQDRKPKSEKEASENIK